jgi:neutral ceramidase
MRRRLALFAALAGVLLISLPTAIALPGGLAPGQARKCAPQGSRFCAGSATADITPPVTSPQFAYTFRHCGLAIPNDTANHVVGAHEHVEEFAFWLAGGGPGCTQPDTEAYSKTFPPSEGTYGRLMANAFVLDDGAGRRVAIVQADLGGIPGELHDAVAARTEAAGVTVDNLMISATHTHGSVGGIFASGGYAALGGDLYDQRIVDAVADGIANAVIRAAGKLAPAKMAVGFGEIHGANGNRQTGAWSLNPEARDGIDGPQATRLMVIRVDRYDGLPLGVITNFTNHGVIHGTFNYFLTGDNQGQATRQVSRAIRARAEAAGVDIPDDWQIVDALTNGPAGDITPRSDDGGWDWSAYGEGLIEDPAFKQFARMENGGARQVNEAVELWDSLGDDLTSDVRLDYRSDWVCFCGQDVGNDPHDHYDREDIVPHGHDEHFHEDDPNYFGTSDTPILGTDDGTSFDSTVFPGQHRKKPRIIAAGKNVMEPEAARIQVMRINDLALVTMPGEPTIQMGRRIERSIKEASGGAFNHVVNVGLANDYVSYMSTTQEYEAYRYEGMFTLWGQQTGNMLKERLLSLTGWMLRGESVPECTRERGCLRATPVLEVPVAPPRFAPDVAAGTADTQPASAIERFDGVRFTWIGGSPGSEWSPDDAVVEVQRQNQDGSWSTVATDLDPEVPLRYRKRATLHTWTAHYDLTKDAPVGTYRFLVTGHAGTAGGGRSDYVIESSPFTVSPSTDLTVANIGGEWKVVHPAPNGAVNFRYREKVSTTAVVDSAYSLTPGTTIPAGAIVDAWGNTNGQAVTVG